MSVFGYGLEPYGTGPYGGLGGVSLPATVPPLGGYGGYGYGTGSYGSLGTFGAPAIAVTGGYGGCAYGTSSYGCVDSLGAPPEVIAAVSITGFIIEVFFSVEMSPDADLFDPNSYTLLDVTGAAPAVVLSVEIGVDGTWGPTSVLLNHTGTTLGGLYTVVVSGPRDIGGTAIAAYAPLNRADVLCKGEAPPFTVTPISGSELRYDFEYDMLEESGFSPGILQPDAYGYETVYPQNIIPQAVEHPFDGDLKQVKVDVIGMTSAEYIAVVSPATAISYDASYLPNASGGDFLSQQVGFGTTTQGPGEVLLSKQIGFGYGWRFLDSSGKLIPNSSYRIDVTFDASSATKIDPAPNSAPVVLLLVNDGAVEVRLSFRRDAGVDLLEIESGGFSASASIAWSTQEVVVSLARNQRADTYTVVVNGEPVVSGLVASFDAPPGFPAGVQFMLDPSGAYEIEEFPLRGVVFTATQTVFSAAWNFLHNQQSAFIGSAANASNSLLTAKGPLVKQWGDATPATKQDVVVYVNDVAVEVLDVNPYYGKITLAIPIPLVPPGTMSVAVDYVWFPSPIMSMAGLNTPGLVLNKYDCRPRCPSGGNSSSSGLPGGGTNGIQFSRFPMGVVLGPGNPNLRMPLLRSPRFIAFQKPYTAALNSPTTLLLNRNPHQVALSGERREVEGVVTFYEGTEDPTASNPPWSLVGTENITDVIDAIAFPGNTTTPPNVVLEATDGGVFQIYKTTAGPFGTGDVTFFKQEIGTSFTQTIVMVCRFQVLPSVTLDGQAMPSPDGVFVGVGFGCHTNDHLYLVGCLQINDVQHLGMLVDPAFPELAESWELAYQTSISIQDSTTFTTMATALPQLIRERLLSEDLVRIQILSGTQAGVYEIVEVIDHSDGTSEVSLDPSTPFPADPQTYGNRDFTAAFETRWDGDGIAGRPNTYRLVVKNDIKELPQGYAQLFVGGSYQGVALTLEGAPPFAIPPDGVLLYPTGDEGEVFWGSLDRRATNLSNWHFVRYGIDPGATTLNFRQIVVAAEMNSLPEEDPNNIWFLTQEFGTRIIDVTGDQLLLKATCADNQLGVEGQDLSIGYARIEPFLTRRMAIDVDTTFQLDNGVLGAGDLLYVVRDGLREAKLATLLYHETPTTRELLYLPNLSLSGLLLPSQQGWMQAGSLSLARVEGHRLQFQQVAGETLTYSLLLLQTGAVPPPSDNRIFESHLVVSAINTTDISGDTGIFFGSDVGPLGAARGVGLQLRIASGGTPDQVFLFSLETGLEVAAFDADWNDGEGHSYRVVCDSDLSTVTVLFDDVLLGVADLNLFSLSSTDTQASIGFASTQVTCSIEWEDFSVCVLPPTTARRTLGVWLGGDVTDINNWKIPRTDALNVPNSSLSAIVEEMDWRTRIRTRIHRDPGWGVTILRPDLPPPPYFTGDFATQFTEPSAAWISVEYRDLPLTPSGFTLGWVAFGALDPASISQSRIDEVRYRIYRYASEDVIMPPHMTLNQYNVITSGEISKDVTVEEAEVVSTNSTTIDLSILNITADRVFGLSFVNAAGETVSYLPGSFTFDRESQVVTITSYMTLGYYPSLDVPDAEDPLVNNPSLNDTENYPYPLEVLLDPFNPDFDFDSNTYPVDVKVPVSVSYAPGLPITKTYLCSQPLLDGVTLLNEGTPPFDTTQVSKDSVELAWGSRINDPNDVLNSDPDFILNDPFRFLDFTAAAKAQYEEIDFCEVSEGDPCLLSPFCDDSLPGAAEAGAPGNEPGDIGNGLINIGVSGLIFTETQPIVFHDSPVNGWGAPTSSVFLHASGDGAPPGGNLNQSILYTPLGPQTPPSQAGVGSVGWSVFGQLYDTLSNTTTLLFFESQSAAP